ncbi:MAG: hypothetical protein LBQ54_03925 [Planctomycetaceae bacterium]|nr:hypothetical protein [Planctomycetaceae bacterium]
MLMLFLLSGLFGAVGCSGGGLRTEYVEGVVTLDGKILPDATVSFSPVTEGAGTPAVGKTDSAGKYTMTSVRGGKDGAGTTVGKYKVSVFKEVATKQYTEEEIRKIIARDGVVDWGYKVVVPVRYTNPATSGLTAEIVKGKNLSCDFALTSP